MWRYEKILSNPFQLIHFAWPSKNKVGGRGERKGDKMLWRKHPLCENAVSMHVCVFDSDFSESVCYYTNGSVPSQPDPPMLSEPYVKALIISWIKRPNDDEFMLQMEDEATVRLKHSLLTCYILLRFNSQ